MVWLFILSSDKVRPSDNLRRGIFGVLVDDKVNRTQQCELADQKANCITDYAKSRGQRCGKVPLKQGDMPGCALGSQQPHYRLGQSGWKPAEAEVGVLVDSS